VVDAEAPDAERLLKLPRLRIAEVEALEALGDDDRRSSVRREVEVVRVVDRDGGPLGLAVSGSIGVSEFPWVLFT